MSIHDEVLEAALRLCRNRGTWTFSPNEVVKALPHINAQSVRTHIVSRCCVNAPPHHQHRWDYFRRIRRGVYRVEPRYRKASRRGLTKEELIPKVAETAARYSARGHGHLRDTIHAFAARDGDYFFADCAEIAVVTQARTMDELIDNLREAVSLFLEGEDAAEFGLTEDPRLVVAYEMPRIRHGAKA